MTIGATRLCRGPYIVLACVADACISDLPISKRCHKTLADFIPGVEPSEVSTTVNLEVMAQGIRLTVTMDAMHDDVWTDRPRAGFESQMCKLDALQAEIGNAV